MCQILNIDLTPLVAAVAHIVSDDVRVAVVMFDAVVEVGNACVAIAHRPLGAGTRQR